MHHPFFLCIAVTSLNVLHSTPMEKRATHGFLPTTALSVTRVDEGSASDPEISDEDGILEETRYVFFLHVHRPFQE